ncbi:MAG: hypothetical protein J6A88_06060, partial [Oscillospiraceae bacterium]|nr:hypothetical protein [Oscillospiraceae bacterium]
KTMNRTTITPVKCAVATKECKEKSDRQAHCRSPYYFMEDNAYENSPTPGQCTTNHKRSPGA